MIEWFRKESTMSKHYLLAMSLLLCMMSIFSGSASVMDTAKILKIKPTTLKQYKQRTEARVAWAETKIKQLGRIRAVGLFNEFDRTANMNDYIFAYVCNDGQNDHFVLANRIQRIVFTNFYDNPNHVIMRAAYKKHPNGSWVNYSNPAIISGQKKRKKYTYIKMLAKYKICIGSGFSLPNKAPQ